MAQVVVEMSGDEAKLYRSYQRIIDQAAKLDDKHKQLAQSSKETFGNSATASMREYLTGLGSLAGAAQLFGNAMAAARAETQQAMQAVNALTESRRGLLQVSQGPADMQRMVSTASNLAAQYGLNRGEAEALMLASRNENFASAVPLIAQGMGANLLAGPAAGRAAGQIPGLFPGSGLTSTQALSGAFAAAQGSRVNFEMLGQNLPQAAEGASLAGSSPAETMALLSVLTSRFAGPETAAARIKALGTAIGINPQLRGKGVLGGVAALQGMSEQGRTGFLGQSAEQNSAYQIITQEMGAIQARQQTIEAAIRTEQIIPNAVAAAFDTSTAAGRTNLARSNLARATAEGEISGEAVLAGGGYGREASLSRYKAGAIRRGVDPVSRYIGGMIATQGTEVGLPGEVGRLGEWTAVGILSSQIKMIVENSVQLYENLTGASEKLDTAAKNLSDNSGRQKAAANAQPE